ncbi:MAG: alkaline phosphatase [Pirellulales bacterium]
MTRASTLRAAWFHEQIRAVGFRAAAVVCSLALITDSVFAQQTSGAAEKPATVKPEGKAADKATNAAAQKQAAKNKTEAADKAAAEAAKLEGTKADDATKKAEPKKPVLDAIAALQQTAIETNTAQWGHWGPDSTKYSNWKTHSNRLIPIYIWGGDLSRVAGTNSLYRDANKIEKLFGFMPTNTVNPEADYLDQTDAYRLQKWGAESGKKRIVLFVFDGMDWQTTRAAAIVKAGKVTYDSGRGNVLQFQTYAGAPTDFGFYVTTPHNEGTAIDVDAQRVTKIGGKIPGGYDAKRAGSHPWDVFPDPQYPISTGSEPLHAYTDSASSATSLTCGIKTYNDAIGVDFAGRGAEPIARTLQEQGFAVGVVTSVPISHATPAAAYASNVHRDDYQDLTRDLIGVPSAFHPGGLPGVDVLIGCGWGESKDKDEPQGKNFVPGNRYLTAEDMHKIDASSGGKYVIAQRTRGERGPDVLRRGAEEAIKSKQRLLGYFGTKGGHLPFRTADGRFDPVISAGTGGKAAEPEVYTPADVNENPVLADMTVAALDVLQSRSDRWWLMVEAGDVDWGNHANNIDNSIGAVLSGDAAFGALTKWVEAHGGWDDTLVIVTADHGHYLVLEKPEQLAEAGEKLK